MRLALGILVGYLVMAALVGVLFLAYGLLAGPLPDTGTFEPSTAFLVVAELWGLLAAVAGGYVTTWLARRRSWGPAGGLVAFCWILGYASLVAGDGQEPLWFSLTHFAVMLAGVLLGAGLRLRAARPEGDR